MKTHQVKIWDVYFQDIITGVKPFEFRKNDRDYHVGDIVLLEERVQGECGSCATGRFAILWIKKIYSLGAIAEQLNGYVAFTFDLIHVWHGRDA